jgi:tetratricopeptide (TPR) repeat protein
MNLNRVKEAESLMDRYLEANPADPFILTEKALLVQKVKNDPDTAITLLEKARKIYPSYYYSNYLLASILFFKYPGKNEQVDKAIKYLELSIKDNNEFYESHYLLGLILSDRGKYEASNRHFDQCNRLEEKLEVYYYMSSNYLQLQDEAGEIAVYNKILELFPGDYKALSSMARIYSGREDYKTAARYLEKLWTQYPENRKIINDYLYALFVSGQDDKFMELSGSMDIEDSRVLVYARALILSRRKQYTEAIKYLKKVKPKDARSFMLMAEIYIQKQDYFSAYEILDNVEAGRRDHLYYSLKLQTLSLLNLNRRIADLFEPIKQNKTLAEKLTISDYYTIFYALANLDRLDALKKAAQFVNQDIAGDSELLTDLRKRLTVFSPARAMKLDEPDSKFSPNIFLLLTFYKNGKHYDQAAEVLKRLIASGQGERPGPHLELCDIYLKQERFKETGRSLKEMLRRFPKSTSVKNFYAYFLALRNKQLQHALELSAGTLAEDKENPAYIDTYGYILFKLGRLAEAGDYLKKAYHKHPLEPEIMEHLADYYRKKNKHYRILNMYQKALDNGVDFKEKLADKINTIKNANNESENENE